jgi:hypothetical protein
MVLPVVLLVSPMVIPTMDLDQFVAGRLLFGFLCLLHPPMTLNVGI